MPEHANGQSPMQHQDFANWYVIPFDDKWTERKWPGKRMQAAPRWVSVDLRDGNQAPDSPVNHDKKLRFFNHLVELGFKEIEVGSPAASQTDFDFCRYIIENKLIPDDVSIQVPTQCREPLIKRTIEAMSGAQNVVLHVDNSGSELQRRGVFENPRDGINAFGVESARLVKTMVDQYLVPLGCNVMYAYSPVSFTGTELDFAIDVCETIVKVLAPEPNDKFIVNLPSTVGMSTPNTYADQIEWMCAHFDDRSKVIVSVQSHNDRGCAIAAAELAVLAGADRVEGSLFGNGERTGNVCLVTMAMNLFSQGVDPELDLSDIQQSIDVAEYCNGLKVPERYPWSGSSLCTAISDSHHGPMNKGMSRTSRDDGKIFPLPFGRTGGKELAPGSPMPASSAVLPLQEESLITQSLQVMTSPRTRRGSGVGGTGPRSAVGPLQDFSGQDGGEDAPSPLVSPCPRTPSPDVRQLAKRSARMALLITPEGGQTEQSSPGVDVSANSLETLEARKAMSMAKLHHAMIKCEKAWDLAILQAKSKARPKEVAQIRSKKAPNEKPSIKVEFRVNFVSRPGQDVLIVGSCRELGQWHPESAIPMAWTSGHDWVASLQCPVEGAPILYKYIVRDAGQIIWEEGHNHAVRIPRFRDVVAQHDVWGHGEP